MKHPGRGIKIRNTILDGNPQHYRQIGSLGGKKGKADGVTKGFALRSREETAAIGRIGGTISRRGNSMKTKLSKQKIVTLKREYSQLKRELQEESRYQVTSLTAKYGQKRSW